MASVSSTSRVCAKCPTTIWVRAYNANHTRPTIRRDGSILGDPYRKGANITGKTAIRVLQGPAYQKAKKVPAVKDEAEAMALMERTLPK